MIEIHINNINSKIKGLDDIQVIDAISRVLTYRLDSARYSWQFKSGLWDGATRLLTKNLQFPSGCLETVLAILERYKVKYQLIDKRQFYEPSRNGFSWHGYDLYPYQEDIVDVALDKKSGMIKAATGAGKSIVIARMVYEYNLPTVIYVVSLDLLSQMHETLVECLQRPIGIVGGGKCFIEDITVCSAWTAGRVYRDKKNKTKSEEDVCEDKWNPDTDQTSEIKDMIESAKLIMLDEAQFAAADSIRSILRNSKSASHRFGLSASPWRSAGDDLLLEAAFGPNICDLKATELIKNGYLVPPKIVFRDVPPPANKIKKSWQTVKSEYIIDNDIRNDLLIRNVNSLLDMGRKPLVLFREHKHGKILESLLPADINYSYVTGELSKTERDVIRDDFKAGNIDLILASTVYDQGIDLPGLDALVLAGGGKSTAKALQRVGRVIRSNPEGGKKDAYVVDTFDQTHYVKSHSIARYGIYATEPGFVIKTGPKMSQHVKRYVR